MPTQTELTICYWEGVLEGNRAWLAPSVISLIESTIHDLRELEKFREKQSVAELAE